MVNILKYSNYRSFLKSFIRYSIRLNPQLSQRCIALNAGIDPSLFNKIIAGTRNLSFEHALRLARHMKLTKPQRDYFELLIRHNHAKSHAERAMYHDKIFNAKRRTITKLKKSQSAFYTKWYISVVREIVNGIGFKNDFTSLSKFLIPNITPDEAKLAIDLLEALNMITKNEFGVYVLNDKFVTPEMDVPVGVLHSYQLQMMTIAIEALNKIGKESREISTLTVSLSEEGFQRARRKIIDTRREILEIARDDGEKITGVFQINFQAFPVALIRSIKE
jgi:uncharacterized protein (TIGR02147 family)